MLHAIAYVSAASWNLLDEQLDRIVAEARRRNTLNGITGVLLYCDGNFMQYLEGEEDAVMETFARIRASESHYQISELMNQPILEREFTDWSMGFSRPSPDEPRRKNATLLRNSPAVGTSSSACPRMPSNVAARTSAGQAGSGTARPSRAASRRIWPSRSASRSA